MIQKHAIALTLVLLLVGPLGCRGGSGIGVDESQVQGFKVRTFFNSSENVEVAIASDGSASIVALPKTTMSRRQQLGDDEVSCLAKCVKIEDLEARLNCILLCPVSKQWQVAILRSR